MASCLKSLSSKFWHRRLEPGQIVIMDHARIHQGKKVQQLIEARDCQMLFLPASSPDFSPIEEAKSCDQGCAPPHRSTHP